MNSKRLLTHLTLLIVSIFLLNFLAMKFYWYSSIWYFDMLMHFLGGIWLGLIFIYLFSIRDYSFKSILKILLFVLFIGLGWEVFEILINKFIIQDTFNFFDTLSDLFFDLSGGLFVSFYFIKKIMSNNKSNI